MKLELTVPERVGVLHLLAAFDLFVLVFTFLYLGLGFVKYTGVDVSLPDANWEIEDYSASKTLTVISKNSLYLGTERIALQSLASRLAKQKESENVDMILLKFDQNIAVSLERQIIDEVRSLGLRCVLLGSSR